MHYTGNLFGTLTIDVHTAGFARGLVRSTIKLTYTAISVLIIFLPLLMFTKTENEISHHFAKPIGIYP
jgi:hypothetical protein